MKIDQKQCASEAVLKQLEGLGVVLKGFRIRLRKTHTVLAQECGFSRQTLSRIEKGDPSVAIGQVARYVECVGAEGTLGRLVVSLDSGPRTRVRRTGKEIELAKQESCSEKLQPNQSSDNLTMHA